MSAYYNEIDLHAAQWLRNLIAAGHIADGVVDTRSIEDVQPDDLREFTQCHFFAGIGVWSYALRRAGWGDDRPVWTGSCPCQPFSAAGEGLAFADERHLWPAFHHLIKECRPSVVVGEQVASKAVDAWIDLVHADLEAVGYTFGSIPFPSAGVGAPHIRDRNYWVAHADSGQQHGVPIVRGAKRNGQNAGWAQGGGESKSRGDVRRLADANKHGRDASAGAELHDTKYNAEPCGSVCGVADAADLGQHGRRPGEAGDGRDSARVEPQRLCDAGSGRPSPTNGFWRDADWLGCRDGKWRPVEPGTFPLAHGATARVGQLRAFGNAINAEQARIFIECIA